MFYSRIICTLYFVKNEKFLSQRRFELLVANMNRKPLLRDLCCEAFMTLVALNEHKQNQHRLRADNDFLVCCHCKSVFTVGEELSEHLQVHNCEKLDPETHEQRRVFKKVAEMKPCLCNFCGEAFIDLNSFLSHKEKHERNFTVEKDLNNQLENHKVPHSDITEESDCKYHLSHLSSNPAPLNCVILQDQKKYKDRKAADKTFILSRVIPM